MFVVIDTSLDNDVVIGPFESREAADAYCTQAAKDEGWDDIVELIKETGSAFGNWLDNFWQCVELTTPDAEIMAKIGR